MIQELRFIRDRIRGRAFSLFLKGSCKNLRIDKSAFLSGLDSISLGDNLFINKGCVIQGAGGVHIGNDTLIGPYVQIYSQEHDKKDYKKTISQPVYIGSGCWLGANVIILKGSTIPSNTIVPAGAIVTRKGVLCRNTLSPVEPGSLATT